MSNIEKGYIPIREANTPEVRFAVDFPQFLDTDRVGVNLKNIYSLCKLGGISHLRVLGMSDDEVSRAIPTIVGFNEQGTAYAGKVKTTIVNPSESTSRNSSERDIFPLRQTQATVLLNMSEISRRIQEDKKVEEGVRSPKAWTEYLNRAVKQGIRREGEKHLLTGLTTFEWLTTGPAFDVAVVSGLYQIIEYPTKGAVIVPVVWIFIKGTEIALGSLRNKPVRFSLFVGPQLDRAAILFVASRAKTVVKEIKN